MGERTPANREPDEIEHEIPSEIRRRLKPKFVGRQKLEERVKNDKWIKIYKAQREALHAMPLPTPQEIKRAWERVMRAYMAFVPLHFAKHHRASLDRKIIVKMLQRAQSVERKMDRIKLRYLRGRMGLQYARIIAGQTSRQATYRVHYTRRKRTEAPKDANPEQPPSSA